MKTSNSNFDSNFKLREAIGHVVPTKALANLLLEGSQKLSNERFPVNMVEKDPKLTELIQAIYAMDLLDTIHIDS